MEFIKKLEFGNYTLRFGNEVLLDYYDEIVFPSFLEMAHIRKISDKSEFFFIDTECVILDETAEPPVLGIKGRIIKNTILTRDQIFDGEDLVEDHDELESAPSSFFLLILNTHRLILCKEVSDAPTIENFKSTSQRFLTLEYEKYIDYLYETAKEEREHNQDAPRVTKKSLRANILPPKLRITPLTDEQSLDIFISNFQKIQHVTVKLLPTNEEELDNDEFWESLESTGDEMGSDSTSVKFTNLDQGLNPESVLVQLTSATKLANSGINLRGYDSEGDILKGSNDDFVLLSELNELSKDTEIAASESYERYEHLVDEGKISLPRRLSRKTVNLINSIYERFGR
ncbi:hypothetical protein [Kosakonia sacchari]|uniref:hypothetical protein n=1 Tax=Kosakonia sacchari TaxID=1158459 RepID=UPI001362911C|nr:hypothetical protein [Kosakonia sacchari]QHM95641.1 hypothetical protein FGE25_15800 [Kosakonia sacchari]